MIRAPQKFYNTHKRTKTFFTRMLCAQLKMLALQAYRFEREFDEGFIDAAEEEHCELTVLLSKWKLKGDRQNER